MRRAAVASVVLFTAILLVGVALAVPTGASSVNNSTVSAQSNGQIVDDAGIIELSPSDKSNGKYASVEDDELKLEFDVFEGQATSSADDVFEITALGNVQSLWIEDESDGVTFYVGDDRSDPITESDPISLNNGSTQSIGVSLDTSYQMASSSTFTIFIETDEELPGEGEGDTEDEETQTSSVTLIDTTYSTSELEAGETLTVEATYENTGDTAGEATAHLRVDGTIVDTQRVTVGAGEQETVTFERVMEQGGEFTVAIDEETGQKIVVEPPASDIVVTNTTLEDEEIRPGEWTTVTATLENQGNETGSLTAEFAIGGIVLDTQSVELAPGETIDVSFEWHFQEPGQYALAVSGVDAGVVTVRESGMTVNDRELLTPTTAAVAPATAIGLLFLVSFTNRRRDIWPFN